MKEIIAFWLSNPSNYEITSVSVGLINKSWKVSNNASGEAFLLQSINSKVFTEPEMLQANSLVISSHLADSGYPYDSIIWLVTKSGLRTIHFQNTFWRLCRFINHSENYSSVENPDIAWKVGKAFAVYDKHLESLEITKIKDTIPQFHFLHKYLNLLKARIDIASPDRLRMSASLLEEVDKFLHLAQTHFPKSRIIHNDAKVSNLLFEDEKVCAVIDWDTTMAGHISWDYADIFRSSSIRTSEDHPNTSDIHLDFELLEGLTVGFKSVLYDSFSEKEKSSLYIGVQYIIFEQAVRFLADYLGNDVYYQSDFEDHNLVRSRNQFIILKQIEQDRFKIERLITQS